MLKFLTKHKEKKAKKRQALKKMIGFDSPEFKLTPKKGYCFYSDYFKIDYHCYATILTFFHRKGSDRNHHQMWSIWLLPNLPRDVSTNLLIGMKVMPQKWVDRYSNRFDLVSQNSSSEAMRNNRTKQKLLAQFTNEDKAQIAADLGHGDTYLTVSYRVLVKAPSLSRLDQAVDQLSRQYDDTFERVSLHPFDGQQYDDLCNLLRPATKQLGHNYMMTSSELAGGYPLVSHGITDDFGDYMGATTGDINSSAVLWDIDHFRHHVIIAADQPAATYDSLSNPHQFPPETRGAGMWGSVLAQNAIFDNHRVVHLVLDHTQVDKIGAAMPTITTKIPMNHGAINPLEIFGQRSDPIGAFSQHTTKLRLMAKQVVNQLGDVSLGKAFGDIVHDFYVDQHMWMDNPQEHLKYLRVVGLPHWQYPRLRAFTFYLQTALKQARQSGDPESVRSVKLLQSAFETRMVDENPDLFDQKTSPKIDEASDQIQVIYDFSSLMKRSPKIAMAQLVNALDIATNGLGPGDLLEIHGAENITGAMKGQASAYSVKRYLSSIIDRLYDRDVRVAYLYNSVNKMLHDTEFNQFGSADWVLTGYMDQSLVDLYQRDLKKPLPRFLKNGIQNRTSPLLYYLRRGVSNILFDANPYLDYPGDRNIPKNH